MVARQEIQDVVSDDVSALSPDDDAWLELEPSATLDISWIEDDLEATPVDTLSPRDTAADRVPFSPELALTPPPATRRPAGFRIRRPVIERVRPREADRAKASTAPSPARTADAVEVVPPRIQFLSVYAGAIAAGVASGLAVLFFGQ